MSNTAFKRDIDDPKTIADFAAVVQSLERLRLLLVLTVADIRAVGPKIWNGWKAQLLRELYHRAEEQLAGGLDRRAAARRASQAAHGGAARRAAPTGATRTSTRHLARGYAAYWLSFDAATLARQARLVRAAEASGRTLAVETRVDRWRAVTEVTIYTPTARACSRGSPAPSRSAAPTSSTPASSPWPTAWRSTPSGSRTPRAGRSTGPTGWRGSPLDRRADSPARPAQPPELEPGLRRCPSRLERLPAWRRAC